MLVIPRTWIRDKVVFHIQRKTTRKMGQSRWIDDDQIQRKRTPSFPSHESIVSRNAQKQRKWKIISTLLFRWWYDWNCFSHNYFCQSDQYLQSSLRCVWRVQYLSNKNGDTRIGIEPAKLLIMTPRPSIEIHAQENLLQKYKERVKNFHNKIEWWNFVLMQDSWKQLKSDSTSWQYTLTSSHKLQHPWQVVSTLCHEMTNQQTRKVGFRETPKLDPCWKSQLASSQRVGALSLMPSCLGIGGHPSGSRKGHPRYTSARTTGRPWVAHTNAQRAKRTCHDAYSRQSNTQVFRQTC